MGSTKPSRLSLQLKLTVWFTAITASALLLALLAFSRELTALAADLPGTEGQFDRFAQAWLGVVRDSFLIVLPVMALIGFLTGQRVARPAEMLQRFLAQVREGARPADCVPPAGDELRELCAVANELTRPMRTHPGEDRASPEVRDPDAAPSLLPTERKVTRSSDWPTR